jgi:16S rRNA A1518/A1519 N6-dimethyltransferase RsmA/KsgA/DIM1 with predicted DNA glycosylase/AP lyase activity
VKLLEAIFEKNGISLKARAEDLTPQQYIEIFRELKI